jgi:Family of unknown function (DUF6084)
VIGYEFSVVDVFAEPYAATPQLTARLRITESTGQTVHAIALRCQVRIEPQRRPYEPADEGGLRALFGERDRWADTLRPFLWMQCSTVVQGFTGSTDVDLSLPCTYDFEVAASRYLHALRDGGVPVLLMFSGTVFTRGPAGFAVEQIPWDREARGELPVHVWRDLMRQHFPGTGWLRLEHETLARLAQYKAERGHISNDEALADLLSRAQEKVG